jgi:hypothetical protein
MVAEDLVGDTAKPAVDRKPEPTPVEELPEDPLPPIETTSAPTVTEEPREEPAGPPVKRQRWRNWLRVLWIPLEIATAIFAALIFPFWAKNIDVDPMNRIGQVSGLSALQFRFAIIAVAIVTVLVVAHKLLNPYWRDVFVRIGCAAVAGLATGMVAGGIQVALRDTPQPLWAGGGDYVWIFQWTEMLMRGEEIPDHYGPLPFTIIQYWSERYDQIPLYALKDLQIFGTALFGPGAYLAWRMSLRPMWALGIGVVAMLPFIEPVKPYPQLTLVVMIPVLVALLRQARRSDRLHPLLALLYGAGIGAILALLFQLYTGWAVWCAPGVVLAFLIVTPWRRGWVKALLLAGSALLIFLRITWGTIMGIFSPTGATSDNYFYFDTNTEPAYFAMWRNDRPGAESQLWPPTGELGGVGVFTLLLAIGIGAALWFGWRRSAVISLGCFAAGAWVLRMWLASEQWATMTVRLYPRTTAVLLYCTLLLTGFAVLYGVKAVRRMMAHRLEPNAARGGAPAGVMLIPIMLVLASAASATANRYMPDTERRDTVGYMSWIAHMKRLPDGSCPRWGIVYGCRPDPRPKYEKDILPKSWPKQLPVIKK